MYKLIHPSNVDNVWHLVAPWIAQAIGQEDTWTDLSTIHERAKQGIARIWIGENLKHEIDVVLVSETWHMDGRQILVLRWLAGKNMEEWLQDISVVEAFAAANGFHAVQIWGRPGWIKAMKPLGYKHEFAVVSKPLIRGLH